jgi:hypothetical protein
MQFGNEPIRILDLGPRLEIPADAPFPVRLAALACVYAIDELAFAVGRETQSGDSEVATAVDRVITEQRRVFEGAGWSIRGVTELADGSRGWQLLRQAAAASAAADPLSSKRSNDHTSAARSR